MPERWSEGGEEADMTESNQSKRGRFIVFEGLDGSGKTTQIGLLAERLRKMGRQVHITAEPTESVSGGLLRDALSGTVKRTPCELAALFALDRIHHNVNPIWGIKKMLDEGRDVLCDRYYYSSLAYQGSETDFDWVKSMNIDCPEIVTPDICIFLDLDPERCMGRISAGRSTTEIYEKKEKLERFRARYFEIFDMLGDRVEVIDTDATIEEVGERVFGALLPLIEQ